MISHSAGQKLEVPREDITKVSAAQKMRTKTALAATVTFWAPPKTAKGLS